MPQQYFIGIDGGASKTLGVLIDGEGCLLANTRLGGSAIVGAPTAESRMILASLKQRLCSEAHVSPLAITGIGLGLNGIDFADEFPIQQAELCACLRIDDSQLTLVNDGIAALWGASPAERSVIVQLGTGVTTAYRSGYGQEQLFDHLDAGSIFDLRRALAVLVARMIDGRADVTPLKAAALAHYQVQDEATFAELLFRERLPHAQFATGQQVVFMAWLDGDAAATRLVMQAVEDYAVTACAMIARTGADHCTVAFGGGVIQHAPQAFLALLAERVHARYPEADVISPRLSPAHGAALMTAYHHGLDPHALFDAIMHDGRLA